MTPLVLIPVKPPVEGKSRLSGVLSAAARVELVWHLFDHVLNVAAAAVGPARALVISRDSEVLDYAALRGAGTLPERADRGLNAALDQGRAEAVRRGADAILVLPGDLPFLAAADIDALIATARPRSVVIAPDGRERGTNALLMSPPDLLSFAFGADSFGAHVASARRSGVEPAIVRRTGLSFDVDTAGDYDSFRQRANRRAVG